MSEKNIGNITKSNSNFALTFVEDLNLSVFNMITGINESKTLTKYISCECKCRFDRRKCNSDQWWNNDKCQRECKKRHVKLFLDSCYMYL